MIVEPRDGNVGKNRLWFEQALLPGGWASDVLMTVLDGLILDVAADVARPADEPAHGAAVPGLGNLHSHAFQRGMAGLAEVGGPVGDTFWTWRETMYRFVGRMGPDEVEAVAALAYVEMIEGGFTRVGEFHYLHHDLGGRAYDNPAEMAERIAAAAAISGIGLTLLPVFYAHSGFGGLPPAASQKRFVHDLDSFARLLEASRTAIAPIEDGVLGVAPHSLRAVTAEELATLIELAGGGPIHIHIAEQRKEVDDCLAWSGQRPLEWLLSRAPVGANWCLVHATHATARELRQVVRRQAVAGLCPITEANLGDGIFPAKVFRDFGGAFGVGSDSNVLIDPAEELRTLEYAQRMTRRARNVLSGGAGRSTGGDLFRAALAGGAQVLGVPAGFVAGAAADIVAFDTGQPGLAARRGDALLDSWMFGGARAVDAVWRRGRKLVSGGRHHARAGVEARYRQALTRLLA